MEKLLVIPFCKVIMLPTKDRSSLGVNENQIPNGRYDPAVYHEAQHLYLVSEREIKEGDWCIYPNRIIGKLSHPYDGKTFINSKKIEATTDPSLGLPVIPQSFIEEYVAKQGNVKEVMVEMMNDEVFVYDEQSERNNTIIISPVKESWTREEVRILLKLAVIVWTKNISEEEIDKWINENL